MFYFVYTATFTINCIIQVDFFVQDCDIKILQTLQCKAAQLNNILHINIKEYTKVLLEAKIKKTEAALNKVCVMWRSHNLIIHLHLIYAQFYARSFNLIYILFSLSVTVMSQMRTTSY